VSNELKSVVGARVRAARKGAGLTQAQLAESLGRTVEAVSNIERGKSLPPLDVLEKISAKTGCPLPELVQIPDAGRFRAQRAELESRLFAASRVLSMDDLRIAVVQIEALLSKG
jgi:transcriptional regulator with XRE-family HTH domain